MWTHDRSLRRSTYPAHGQDQSTHDHEGAFRTPLSPCNIRLITITKNSASYFLGDAKNDSLQRIYGISFPDKKQLTDYKKFLEEAARRDHRKIAREQELFFFNDLSPGSCFFLPHGTRIYNTLLELMRVR
jgi:threonyl-tRNA synthetase